MDIPAVYAVLRSGEIRAAPVRMDGVSIWFDSEPAAFIHRPDAADRREPIVVADVKGLGKGELDDRLLTRIKIPGSDVWFLTHVEDVDDIFDCFMGDIAKVLIPYHTVRNSKVLEEAYEVSDNCIPILFVSQGKAVCRGGKTKDIMDAVEELERIGFAETAVLDTDGMMTADDWAAMNGRSKGLIPYVRDRDKVPSEIGFRYIISDL
jgi:hypothetical protein